MGVVEILQKSTDADRTRLSTVWACRSPMPVPVGFARFFAVGPLFALAPLLKRRGCGFGKAAGSSCAEPTGHSGSAGDVTRGGAPRPTGKSRPD